MFTAEEAMYKHDSDDRYGTLVDVSFGRMNSGDLGMSVHNRSDGYTGVVAVNKIWTEWNQSSAVGGHCHWQEIHVTIGTRHLWFTPNNQRTFAKICEQVKSL